MKSRRLIKSRFSTRRVQVAPRPACTKVGRIRPEGLVLRAKAVGAIQVVAHAVGSVDGQDDPLDILGVVTKAGPGLAVRKRGEGVVNRGDVFGGVEVGDVAAEVPEVFGTGIYK